MSARWIIQYLDVQSDLVLEDVYLILWYPGEYSRLLRRYPLDHFSTTIPHSRLVPWVSILLDFTLQTHDLENSNGVVRQRNATRAPTFERGIFVFENNDMMSGLSEEDGGGETTDSSCRL